MGDSESNAGVKAEEYHRKALSGVSLDYVTGFWLLQFSRRQSPQERLILNS